MSAFSWNVWGKQQSLSDGSLSRGWDLKPGHSEYETGVTLNCDFQYNTKILFGEEYTFLYSSLWNFLQPLLLPSASPLPPSPLGTNIFLSIKFSNMYLLRLCGYSLNERQVSNANTKQCLSRKLRLWETCYFHAVESCVEHNRITPDIALWASWVTE